MTKRFLLIAMVLIFSLTGIVIADETPLETIYVEGASHIDLAWKWDYARAHWIFQNTFGSVLNMMDHFDDYGEEANPVFYAQSNALGYQWVEEADPSMFERVSRRIEEGRWEVVGGMWVESDAMLPSGESFCRQFLTGQWYFYDKFKTMATVGWLPDSFGYNANLPQFMRKSGVNTFFFFKLNWNDTNQPDYHLFRWKAPDGSQVLSHLSYARYNNSVSTKGINSAVAEKRFTEPMQPDVFFPIGIGNHGGGITWSNINKIQGMAQAGYNVQYGRVDDFFKNVDVNKIDKTIENDELYFEFHRGTYTNRAEHKKSVRELEYKLQNAELFSSLATLLGKQYPAAKLDEAWKKLLRDQFHDTMAGTCLVSVYEHDVEPNLAEVRNTAENAISNALSYLSEKITTNSAQGQSVVIFNPNGFELSQYVAVLMQDGNYKVTDHSGQAIPAQYSSIENALLFKADAVPAWGWRTYTIQSGQEQTAPFDASETHLENDRLAVTLDANGNITSLQSKILAKEFIEDGQKGNLLQIYNDRPDAYPAWNLGYDKYHDTPTDIDTAESVTVVENGPVRQVIEITRQGQAESYLQRIILYAGESAVDFEIDVSDWGHPRNRFLKVAFPTGLSNPKRSVRANIPYGHLERILDGHRADWEFVGHKWVDLTDNFIDGENSTAGLTLYSLEKYGYDVANDGPGIGLSDGRCNILRLSLLKSSSSPLNTLPDSGGPVADQGDFSAHYRVLLHDGQTPPAQIYMAGEGYANKLIPVTVDSHEGVLPPMGKLISFSSQGGQVIPTTMKRPYRGGPGGEMVFRLLEITGVDSTVSVDYSAWNLEKAFKADILERPQSNDLIITDPAGNVTFSFDVGHFSVDTLRIEFGDLKESETEPDEDDPDQGNVDEDNRDDPDGACCG